MVSIVVASRLCLSFSLSPGHCQTIIPWNLLLWFGRYGWKGISGYGLNVTNRRIPISSFVNYPVSCHCQWAIVGCDWITKIKDSLSHWFAVYTRTHYKASHSSLVFMMVYVDQRQQGRRLNRQSTVVYCLIIRPNKMRMKKQNAFRCANIYHLSKWKSYLREFKML